MKIIVGVSTGKEFELVLNDGYNAEAIAGLVNLDGVMHCNYLVATDGSLIMPKHVVYIREENDTSNKTRLEPLFK